MKHLQKILALALSAILVITAYIPGTLASRTVETSGSHGTGNHGRDPKARYRKQRRGPKTGTGNNGGDRKHGTGNNGGDRKHGTGNNGTGDRDRSIRTAGGAHGAEAGFHG